MKVMKYQRKNKKNKNIKILVNIAIGYTISQVIMFMFINSIINKL